MKYEPRRPLDEDFPHRYMESDTDYLLNNRDLAVVLLDNYDKMIDALKALTFADSPIVRAVARSGLPEELLDKM